MTLRVARHTNQLELIEAFYINIIGLVRIGGFKNHDGYDGVFLGASHSNWHLEFTTSTHASHTVPDPDDLLVFYTTEQELLEIKQHILNANIVIEKPRNPYWQQHGVYIKDPDGFGVIITTLPG